MPAKMPGKFEKSGVLFAYVIQDANRAGFLADQPYDFAPRTAKLPLQRLHSPHWAMEMLLKELLKNFHV
jgi:hypothetical protein